jgi:hypothetical protein
MIDFHRKSGPGAPAPDTLGRVGRLAGRLALWGCVLLLLLRGLASILAGPPQPAKPSVVTVTQPAAPAAGGRGR